MLRNEPGASFRVAETTRPDPRHRGVRFVARRYFLASGGGAPDVELTRDRGEAIAAGQWVRPQQIGHIVGRHWWIYRDRVYSATDRLGPAAVLRLIERELETARERLSAATGSLEARPSGGRRVTA